MAEEAKGNGIPTLPCPNCGENILDKGFYNYCNETVSLREDNYAHISNGRLYIDHDEDDHETQDHECDLDAHCRNCNKLLPWATFDIRDLDGLSPTDAQKAITELLEQAQA